MRVDGQRHSPAALPPGMTRYPLYRMLSGPQGRSGRMRKISPPTDIRSPDRPTSSELLYRPCCPGPVRRGILHTEVITLSRLDNPSRPRPLLWGSSITLRHFTLGRALLDEWSARRRDLYLTTGIKPASERPQTHALDRAGTGIGSS
jgi:hypothetical protein